MFSVHERWLPSRLPELRLEGLDARVALLDLGTRLLDLHARQVMQAAINITAINGNQLAISGNQWQSMALNEMMDVINAGPADADSSNAHHGAVAVHIVTQTRPHRPYRGSQCDI